MSEPNYYAIIPANVRYDNDLTANAKLLYGEITALCNKEGFCWANNRYFATLYGVSITSVSTWLSQLTKKGYLISESEEQENGELKRKIYLPDQQPIKDILNTPLKNLKGVSKETDIPHKENLKHNSTVNNTSNNSISSIKKNKENILQQIQLPFDWDSKEFFALWGKYIANRKGRPLTAQMANDRVEKLNSLSGGKWEIAKIMLEKSGFKGWDEFYLPDTKKTDQKPNYDKWKK